MNIVLPHVATFFSDESSQKLLTVYRPFVVDDHQNFAQHVIADVYDKN